MSLPPNNFDPPRQSVAGRPEPGPTQVVEKESFLWGVVGGIAGAIMGVIVYVAFTKIAHSQLGYALWVAVAWLVAKGIMMGSRAKGGLEYQITAFVLTCAAVAAGQAALVYLSILEKRPLDLSFHGILLLANNGAKDPILGIQSSGVRELIGVAIFSVGLHVAWRMTSEDPEALDKQAMDGSDLPYAR